MQKNDKIKQNKVKLLLIQVILLYFKLNIIIFK